MSGATASAHACEEDGHLVREWWVGERKLTLDVYPDRVEWMRVWGTNIFDEMSDGVTTSAAELAEHVHWLLGGKDGEG